MILRLAPGRRSALLLVLPLVGALLAGCTSSASAGHGSTAGAAGSSSVSGSASRSASPSHPASSSASSTPSGPTTTVRVTSLLSDGGTYGVGMPIVMYFKPAPKDVKAFEAAVKVTVNGQPANGAWYWEQPLATEVQQNMVEAHYREQGYWPANSKIHVSIPIGGLSAGPNLAYAGALDSLDFAIGDKHVTTVSANSYSMTVTSNDKVVNTFKVSLGKAATPTYSGTKVVMQKGEDVPGTNTLRPNGTVMMNGPGYTNDPVQWSVRVTQSGEYVHAAPWNNEIGARSTSNGCTNLHVADAQWFYNFAQIGDVVTYPDAPGGTMRADDGLGDWNVNWAQWQRGGLF